MTSLSQFAVTATTLSNTELREDIKVLYEELFSRLKEEPESGAPPARHQALKDREEEEDTVLRTRK
ncbi:hypothetical protein LCGC14_2170340, partial [marine sediment metagenome]